MRWLISAARKRRLGLIIGHRKRGALFWLISGRGGRGCGCGIWGLVGVTVLARFVVTDRTQRQRGGRVLTLLIHLLKKRNMFSPRYKLFTLFVDKATREEDCPVEAVLGARSHTHTISDCKLIHIR